VPETFIRKATKEKENFHNVIKKEKRGQENKKEIRKHKNFPVLPS
jgi:hypothetical protein